MSPGVPFFVFSMFLVWGVLEGWVLPLSFQILLLCCSLSLFPRLHVNCLTMSHLPPRFFSRFFLNSFTCFSWVCYIPVFQICLPLWLMCSFFSDTLCFLPFWNALLRNVSIFPSVFLNVFTVVIFKSFAFWIWYLVHSRVCFYDLLLFGHVVLSFVMTKVLIVRQTLSRKYCIEAPTDDIFL